jgi:hypothetical protein
MTADERLRDLLRDLPDLDDPEVKEQLRADLRLLRDHPSAAEGDAFLEAALAELAEELERLERRQAGSGAR